MLAKPITQLKTVTKQFTFQVHAQITSLQARKAKFADKRKWHNDCCDVDIELDCCCWCGHGL